MASEAGSPDNAASSTHSGGILQRLRNAPLIPLMLGVALAATLLMGVVFWSAEPNYGMLYSGLDDRDGGEIIAQLDQMQVPYRVTSNGTAILVPRTAVDKTRMTLAGQGLPKGGNVGYELMDEQSFGISQFAEHVNYNRALEGELGRSIGSIETVSNARVHLAIPESSVFVREEQMPTASVVLDLYQGRRLSEGQVNAIQHMVASSVNELPADSVTVVDAGGRLLSADNADSKPMSAGASSRKLDYVARIEKRYQARIQDLLAPLFGADNVRAQVVANVDFSTGEHTQETYTPNENTDEASIRSEQRNSSQRYGSDRGGVPGALSNQPDPEVLSPINDPANPPGTGNNNPDGGAPADQLANSPPQSLDMPESAEQSSTINYEVNRRIEHVQRESGRIERLSVAVVINKTAIPAAPIDAAADTTADAQAADTQAVERDDARIAAIRRLLRGAVGYSQARGDTLEIVRAPFNEVSQTPAAPAVPWWKNRDLLNMVQTAFKYLVLAIAVILIWRRVIRPLLDRGLAGLGPGAPAASANAANAEPSAADEGPDAETLLRQRRQAEQRSLREETVEAARNDPQMAAMIVKGWMNNG